MTLSPTIVPSPSAGFREAFPAGRGIRTMLAISCVALLCAMAMPQALADNRNNHGHDNRHADQGRRGWHGEREKYAYRPDYRRPYYYAQPVYVPPPVYYEPRQSPGVSFFFPLDLRR